MMRKASWILGVAVAALVATGAAVAHGGGGAKSATAVAGTFAATDVANAKTTTCTNADGSWTRVDATYRGTAAGDADLAGPARLDVHATINTTKNLGLVTGTLRIDTAGADTKAGFRAVYSGGRIVGLAEGRTHEPAARLIASLSAAYSPTGGFTDGELGGGTAGGTALELVSGTCAKQAPEHAKLLVRGTVVSASATSLVIRTGGDQVTCAVGSSLADKVARLQTGNSVLATCSLSNGTYTLVSLRQRGDREHVERAKDARHR
jgi:hypothetical protein